MEDFPAFDLERAIHDWAHGAFQKPWQRPQCILFHFFRPISYVEMFVRSTDAVPYHYYNYVKPD